ncbi:MAG: beta strand repeat-containing protein, partial [Limisphaerales bacterium]
NNTLTLGAVTGTPTDGSAGAINIDGGALIAGSIANGGGAAAINVTNGALTVTGQAGTAAAPLNSLYFAGAEITLPETPSSTNITVSSLMTGGATNVISISSAPPSTNFPVQVTLIKYGGSIGGAGFNFGIGTLPPLTAGYISNNTANGSIDLVLTSGLTGAETWTASVNDNWDTTTANWLVNGSSATYANGAFVQFFDGANSGAVNLTTSLSPGGLTVSNNILPYTFEGSGNLAGSVALNKAGTNALVVDNSGDNSFTGGVNIDGGILQVGNNDANGNLPPGSVVDNGALVFDQTGLVTNDNTISGTGILAYEGGGTLNVAGVNSFSGPVIVTNSSTLQLGGSSALGSGGSSLIVVAGSTLDGDGHSSTRPIVVSGAGVNGNGALTDTGGAIDDSAGGLSSSVTLIGDTTFSIPGPNRWDLGSSSGAVLSTGGNAYNLTLNAGVYFEWENLSVDPALANIDLEGSGTFGVVGTTTFGNPADTLTIGSSAQMDFYGTPFNYVNKVVDFQDGIIDNARGNNFMNGTMTLEPGYCQFESAGGTSLTLSNILTGSGVLYENGDPGTLVLAGSSPSFSGGALVYQGELILNGLIGSGITTEPGTTLSGSGTADGLVDVSGGFAPGSSAGGTFNAAGGLTLEPGAGLTNSLAPAVSGSSDLTAVTGNLTVNGNTIYINPFAGELQSGGVYPIITYTGTLTGSFAGAQSISPGIYSFTITNITGTTPEQIAVIVSGNPANLTWNDGAGNGQWDVLSSDNWTNIANLAEAQFENGDNVAFNDSISNSSSATPTNVTVASGVSVLPALVSVNNSAENYTFSGLGTIGDSASLVKTGAGALSVSMTNTYSGSTIIGAGTVSITGQLSGASSPLGSTNGSLVISNGASLVIKLVGGYPPGDVGFGDKPIVVSGAGINGQGAIQNIGNALYDDSSTFGLGQNVTLTGDTTVGGTARLDWGWPGAVLSTGGSNYNLTVIESKLFQWVDLTIDTNLGNIDISNSTSKTFNWNVFGVGQSLGNPTNVLTLHSNITMDIGRNSSYPVPAADYSGYAKVIHVLPTATYENSISGGPGDYRDSTSFILEGGSAFEYFNGTGGTNSGTAFSGPVSLNGLVHLQVANSLITFSNVISGPGGFYVDLYGGQPPLVFAAANTYTGITDIRTNINVALVGNGSIANSTPISLSPGATLAVTNRTDGTLTLSSGQTLEGRGTIQGNLIASAGSTLAAGTTSTTTNLGTLTVSGNATLDGNTSMRLNNPANDVISVGNTLAYGGTLTLSSISATPLAAGDTFTLFKAASYTGSFSSISPASPGSGLAWNASNLAVNGTLSVVSTAPPRISSISVNGPTLTIVANNGPANAAFVLMETTNILTPLPWTPVLTNSFDGSGGLDLSTNIISPNVPVEFYILQVQ